MKTYAVCQRYKDGEDYLHCWANEDNAQAICDELNAMKPNMPPQRIYDKRYGPIEWGKIDCFFVSIVDKFDTTGN